MKPKNLMEVFIWQCEECGRLGRFKFYEHAPNKNSMRVCVGKVKRIKFKNAW